MLRKTTPINGGVFIREKITSPDARRHFEKAFRRKTKLAEGENGKNYHAAHAFGAGFGTEHKEGITYAPVEVNLRYQNSGIEEYCRELYQELDKSKYELWAGVTVFPVSHTDQRLSEITYSISVGPLNGENLQQLNLLFEATIAVYYPKLGSPRVALQDVVKVNDVERFLSPRKVRS